MKLYYKILYSLFIFLLIANAGYAQKNISYPKSNLIEKLEWTTLSYKYPGTYSDLHWWRWGIDDAIFYLQKPSCMVYLFANIV